MNKVFYVGSPIADAIPALTLGQGFPKTVNGQDAFYFWRKSARDGTYKHPVKGFSLTIDSSRRKGWVNTFKAMNAGNVEVPIVKDHKETAESTLGYVVDARNNGDWYEELHQYLGAEARDVALRNKISIGIQPSLKDGTGKTYTDAIRHSAVTPLPVIPGTGAAEPFMASAADDDADYFLLSSQQGDPAMDLLKKLREAFGADDLTEATAFDRVKTLIETGKNNPDAQKLSAVTTERDELKVKLEKSEAKVLELSRDDTPTDPEVLLDRHGIATDRIELSIKAGDMPNTVGKKLLAKLGTTEKPSGFMLSRHEDLGTRPVDFVVDLFKDTKLGVKEGSKTGIQTLARLTPGEGHDAKSDDAWVKERAAAVSAPASK